MKFLAMQMTGSNGVLSVPSEHIPGLVVLVALPLAIWIALAGLRTLAGRNVPWAVHLLDRLSRLSFTARIALIGSLVGAIVHAAIVPTHWGDARVTAILFIVDTVGFSIAIFMIVSAHRHWRSIAVAMLGGTACVYGLYILASWETMDLVGLVTTTTELAAALVVIATAPSPATSLRRERWIAAAAIPVALFSLLGTSEIASATSSTASSAAPSASPHSGMDMSGMSSASSTATKVLTTDFSLDTTSPAGSITWPDHTGTMAAGMEMATGHCTAQPTASQKAAAVSLVDQTVAAAAPFKSLAVAKAAGYVPLTPSGQRIVHYINPAIYRQGHLLDPAKIPVLVYVNTVHGAVLLAAMYLMPQADTTTKPPQPGGCLTQWHVHTDLCMSGEKVVGNDNNGACAAGSSNHITPPMMHVWMTSVGGGPLAPDPSGRSEVISARSVPLLTPLNARA